jgi:hypothetical protein
LTDHRGVTSAGPPSPRPAVREVEPRAGLRAARTATARRYDRSEAAWFDVDRWRAVWERVGTRAPRSRMGHPGGQSARFPPVPPRPDLVDRGVPLRRLHLVAPLAVAVVAAAVSGLAVIVTSGQPSDPSTDVPAALGAPASAAATDAAPKPTGLPPAFLPPTRTAPSDPTAASGRPPPLPEGRPTSSATSAKKTAHADYFRGRSQFVLYDDSRDGHSAVLQVKIDDVDDPRTFFNSKGITNATHPPKVVTASGVSSDATVRFRVCVGDYGKPVPERTCGKWSTATGS